MPTLVLQPVERTADDVRQEIARRSRLFDRPIGWPEEASWLDAWMTMAAALKGIVVAVRRPDGSEVYCFRPTDQAVVISDLEEELRQLEQAEKSAAAGVQEAA